MIKHPRTENVRQDALKKWHDNNEQHELGALTGSALDTLCRQLEEELAEVRRLLVVQNKHIESLDKEIDELHKDEERLDAIMEKGWVMRNSDCPMYGYNVQFIVLKDRQAIDLAMESEVAG